ncbi:helicase-related protein [uncultured Muribaculum sp.]|uniref:helicase-related protein n=1 Tax=uncultured Muribaculum sp. TaxID=1918613 RepID=UPI0025AA2F28|nr:helicase-related protein [uncultured Muribaculum sp.]
MANPNDNLRRLYQNGLKHFSLPDFDTFQQDMRDEEKRKRFYNNMQGAYSLPDFDTFSQDIGAVTPPPAQPQAQAQPQQTTSTVKPVTDNTAQQASVQPTVQTSSQPAQPEGWKPTPMQQRAFQMQMDEANARLKKQGEEFKQRMEGIEKGNRPGAFMGEREFNPQTGKMETHYYTTQGERVGTRMEQSHANTEYHNWWENNTEAGKRSKEQRLQREFDEKLSYLWQRHNPAEGENAAEQAWSAAESAYNAKAERNREAANFNVQNFAMNSTDAVAFKQMETVDNFTDRLTTHDMDVLMDNAWNNLGEEGQKSLIDDCYQMLRRRNPGVDDLVLYGKAKEFARQQSDLRMYHLAVEKNLPKSNLEYFMRKVGDMNLVTNIGKGIAVNRVKKTGDMAAYEAANEQYRQDGHKILDVAGTVTGFALDPTTWMSAGVGGMATRGAMWAGGRVLAGRGATAAVTNAATRQFATSMTGRVIGGIAGGAANFGTFEGIKEMETQFAHGGHIVGQDDTGRYLNEGYSASAVAGQAAHGFLMGGAIGWLTPVSGNVADKLVRSTSSTGLKVMERAGVYSGATMLEGTIFSVPEWIEGNRDAMDVWTDNMAMMVGFKAKHMIKSAGNVLGDLKASFDSPTNGRKNRLDFESRLRQRMDAPSDGGLSLTKDEAAELSKHGYGDLRELVESAERTGDATKGELITANAPEIVSRLTDMVTDPRISEAARAKMYYYATGRKLPESTVMKGELIEDGEGGFIVESQGANGVITSRSFKSRKAADLELERIKRQTELNHIEIGERYQQTADFENRLQEACRTVAAENGWDMVEVYRTCEEARRNNLRGGDKQFDEAQQNILRKVTEAMGEFEETSVTDNMRGRINDKYGVDIDNAIRKEANRRTIAEQTAIDEYLDELIPKNAKERNTVEDAEAEDITNQKLLTDEPEATTPTNDAPIDPRFDNPTTPEYDPHQPGGEQKPVGRAVMKYQDRPVEVLSGRVVMMEDGTMIDNERSDASIVVRDLETGKVEMVSPDAILSYEGYPAEVEVPQDNVAPEAETPAEPQPKYTTGQIKIRNSDGTETRGVLTGFVDENGNHEYYVEGDLQQLHYASEHELDNILSEYTPDEPQEVKQPQPAEPQPVDPNRPTQEGVANVEDYDKGYSFGIDETQGISDSELTAKISELRTDAERLTDFGRGMLEAYEYEQQRRAMEQQLVPVDAETVPKTEETTLNPMETGVNITETVPKTEIPIENVQQSVDDGNVVVPAPATNEAPQVDNVSQPDLTAQAEPTPLQRIPRNEKNEPIFEQAESPEVGWDALVEFSEGDAATAKEIADTMVEEKRKAFEKAQKLKPKGKTPTEILASKKANTAELTKAQAEYEQWQRMAGVENARQSAIRSQQEVEARRLAAERAEAEKAEREAREEAARLEREALEGIPEWHMDTPENARKRGVRRFSGQMFTRQEPVQGVVGNEVEVKFSQKDLPKGRVAVIEASQLQPSHVQGQRNPMFFIEEAQPKNRTEAVSMFAAKEMAEGIRPKEITGSVTAYTGAPTVNTRGEVIQGNNRSDALRYLWQSNLPQQQQTYKQYLIDNAEQFGIDPEAVNAMQNPVLVNMLDVDDAEAIRLGQMTAQDTESGGIERIKPKNVAQTLGDNMRTFANMLLSSGEEDVSFGQLVDRNGTEVMKWMNQVGAISNTQFQSAFDSKSNLTAEAKNDLQKVLYQAVFKGASQQLEEMFDKLPAKAQRAILATAFRDMDSPFAGKMLPEIQASIIVYNQLMSDPTFANAKKMEEVLKAVEAFKQTIALDDRFEHYMPADNFSNFALHLAAMYKATDMSQATIASYFNQMYDLAQGKKAATLFDEADTTEYPLAEVINQVLNFEYQPAKNGNNDVANGGADVALRNQVSQGGELRGNEPPASGEQTPTGTEPSDSGAGASDDSSTAGVEAVEGETPQSTDAAPATVQAAVEAASAEVNTEPTPAQAEAGNYKKGHITIGEFDITIENPAGSVRKGIDADGKEWSTTMANTYGYIKGTEGVDGDHIDVFLHENMDMWNGRKVYVVDQTNTDGSFDEHKVMLGFNNKDEAMSAYLANYDATWGQTHPGLRISETNIEDFNKWVQSSHRKTKPFADYSTVSKITDEAPVEQPTQPAAAITGEGYKVEPKPYTNKQGKTLDTYLVTFDRDFSKEELSTLRAKAKALKGWYDRETRGWMLRSADDAKAFAKDIVGKSEDEVADEAPLSLADMEKPASDKPKKAPVNRVNVEGVMADLSTKGETKLSDHAEPVEPTQTKPKKRRWISDEDADEFNNLRDNLRNHFGKGDDIVQESAEGYGKPQPKQMDAEVLRMGTRMTYLMMKGGLRSFADYCEAMIDELPDIFDDMRPHLKSLYAAAQNMEEVIELGWDEEMDDRKTVKAFDVYNFDKPGAKDIIATSQHIVDEQSSQQHTDQIIQTLKDQRNEQRKKEADETSADTEAIADKAEAVASKVESELEVATTEQDAERLSRDLDKEIEDVNKQLALLGYYEAVEDDSKFHESYGYMLTAEKKAVSDATNLAKQIVKDLGIDIKVTSATTPLGRKNVKKGTTVRANLAPAGGEIYITLPLNEGRHLKMYIGLEPVAEQDSRRRGDNLKTDRIMYRVEWPDEKGYVSFERIGRNCWAASNVTYDELLTAIRREARNYLPEDVVKPATPLTPQPGEDMVQMAERVAKLKAPKKSRIPDEQPMNDLFGGLFDEAEPKQDSAQFVKDMADMLERGESPFTVTPEVEAELAKQREAENNSTTPKNNSHEKTDVQARPETAGRGGQQPRPNEPLGTSAEHEAERTDGGRMAQRGGEHTVSDTKRGTGVSEQHKSERGVAQPKNIRNNHAERGVDYAPKGEKARIDANLAAIEVAKKLLASGETATPKEMEVLRRYSGWGGLGSAFNEGSTWSPNPINKRLREILTPEEYEAAVMSRNSAYYTPAPVIDAMWDIAKALGFKGGNIVEGSAGIGNIIGLMPTEISERSNIHAVEIDNTTGGILSLLYPDAKVEVQGFEKTRIANGSVDLAITNVPFVTGLHVMDESGDSDLSKKFRDIHDFCIAKNVRKLREGGIGIFITSSGTLDKSQKLRNWLVGDKEGCADVVGVFRMNNQTFGGTAATSDIIVVRKRVNGRKSANAIDISTVTPVRTASFEDDRGKTKDLPMLINRYFIEHPEYMGGEMFFGFEQGDTYRPTSMGLFPTRTADQPARMAAWVQHIAEMDWSKEQGTAVAEQTTHINEALGKDVKEGSMVTDSNGNLCVARMGSAVPLTFNKNKIKGRTKEQCFADYTDLKNALADVLKYQTEHNDDAGLQPLLDRLNSAYDTFVARYGNLNKNNNLAWLRNDVDFSSIVALETYSEKGSKDGTKIKTYGKTDIFSRRVVEKESEPAPKNVKDGIIASLYKYGRIDPEYLASQLGKSQADVKQEIIESGLGFENPTTGQMEVSYEYLSGNVREKLRQAREANEAANGAYDANIKALEAVVPMNIPAHLIEFTLGSSWVDPKLYERFVKERTDLNVRLTNAGGTWHMSEPYWTDEPKNKEMGIRSESLGILIPGHKLIEAAITNKTITVSKTTKNSDGTTTTETDAAATTACATKVDEIRQDFKDWAREQMQNDPELSMRMEEVYNEKFNNSVPKSIPDEFVPEHFGGAATMVGGRPFRLRPHQAKAVIRATTQPVLLAHEVGTGKTYTLITTAMEMRRLGTARKPMIVVQNATVGQFVASAKALYPNAKVLTLEDADRNAEGRKAFYAKIKFNDWDMIVVPQSVFERIPDSVERQTQFIQDKIEEKLLVLDQMKDADPDGRSMIVRAAEREIEKLKDEISQLANGGATDKKKEKDAKKAAVTRQNAEVKAREMLDRATDDVEDFDSMGIDAILVDEAHEYKHLGFATAMQRGVKGVDPSFSKKSQGVFLKTQSVLEKTGGKNVVFATGTPISNTAAEIWTFMRYLMSADVMKDYGIYYFDDFVRNFGNLQQMLEFSTSGKYKENNRFAGYVNLPELVRIWSTVADTVLTREAGGVSDKIPQMEGGKAQDIFLPQTRALRSIMKFVKEQLDAYDNMSGKEKKENSHIPLVMYGIAKAAAVDARLVQSDAEDDPNSKTNEAVRQTLRTLEEAKDYNGTVAIFADNYQNKVSGFNLYEDIRKKLISAGVPEEQIVVMKSGMTVNKKLEIFSRVNAGEVRVIMGSTFTLGTGVNIQERLHTLIHLDAPNRPMDYTQRNGRILRQGNLHNEWGIPVRVLRFGVEDSLDVTAYQRLKTKGAIADSIMNGKQLMENSMENRALEEDQDLFGDITAQLSGSEYAMLKNQIEKEVRKLTAQRKSWEADQTYIHNRKRQIAGQNKEAEKRIAENKSYLEKVEAATVGDITVDKLSYPSVEAMEDFFTEQNKRKAELQEQVRKSGYSSRPATSDITISVGGFNFHVHTEINRETKQGQQGDLFYSAPAKMTYSCPELGIEAMPVKGNVIKNAVTEILNDVVSGEDFRGRIEAAERSIERNNAELQSISARDGVPFKFTEELAKAEEKLSEYEDLMKAEMEAKEAKYAELDKEVEAASNIELTEEDSEDAASEPIASYSEENANFASRYETQDGKTINYTSENAEGYGGLFDFDFSGENAGGNEVGMRSGANDLQRQGDTGLNRHNSRLDKEAGEFSLIERVFRESGSFNFTSGEKIESADDVAFIFSALEDAAKEHSFVVLVKDGKPTVVELGMGTFTATMVDIPTASLAYNRIQPDQVYFVHNHPSGNLMCSPQDVQMLRKIADISKVPVHGVIINLKTGKYGTFDTDNTSGVGQKRVPENESPLAVHTLDKQIFAPNYDPMEQPLVRGSEDVAKFLNSQRMGDRAKMSFIILSRAGRIVGNIHTPFTKLPTKSDEIARYISERVIQFGGESAILYGDFTHEGSKMVAYRNLKDNLNKVGGTTLLDVVNVEGNNTRSANDDGLLYELGSEYGASTEAKSSHAERMSKKFNTPIRIVTDTKELTNDNSERQARMRRSKGFYDPATGEVVIVLPNNANVEDVAETVFHEVVAHKGLREMIGEENYDAFCDEIYNHLKDDLKQQVEEDATRRFVNEPGKEYEHHRRVAVDEMFGRMSEKGFEDFTKAERGIWVKLKAKVLEAINKFLGSLKLPKWVKLGDNELRYMLWRSHEKLRTKGDYVDMARDAAKRDELGLSSDARFRDGETSDIWKDQSIGLEERITNAAIRLSNNQSADLTLRNDAMRAVTNNLQSLLHSMRNRRGTAQSFVGADRKVEAGVVDAMNAQAMFDRSTVKRVSDLARILMQNGYLSGMTSGEMQRLLSAVKNATAMHDIADSVQKIMDIMVDNQLRNGEASLRQLLAIRGSKVDARGVEVQGALDVDGQHTMEVVKKAISLTEDDITDRIAEALNRMSDPDQTIADQAAIEYAGLNMALDYVQNIANSKAEEKALRDSLKIAKEDRDAGRMTDDAYKQFIETTEDAIRKNKIERTEAYFNLVGRLSDSLRGSIENAKAFREAEKARISEIHHNANSDMEGRPTNEHHKDDWQDKFVNNGFVQFLFAPLGTFDQIMRVFGNKSANGEGYLWNRFMRGWVDCRNKELRGIKDKFAQLDEKAAELFGKSKTWGDIIRMERKLPKASVSFWDGGEMRDHELTQGNLLYIYMVDKMTDGRMKLRRMGITEQNVADIENFLDPRFKALGDWLQDDFLVATRNEYNETHKRMFGASMAAIENYFPLKILANARVDKEEDVNQQNRPDGITTKTGSIIKRRVNNLALDITGADALSVILDHITQMEHWSAYAEWNRDLNTLRTYKRFRNQVINMTTVYGGGRRLWENFNDLCLMAAGEYRPPVSRLNKNAVNLAKGVTAAKVSFRLFTALKQFLSAPAYAPEVNLKSIAKSIANPYGDFKWCLENLPIFRERWHSRISGDPRLLKSDMDWKMWRSRVMEISSRIGMTPNAFVDAVTVSIGARAMYETRLNQYLKEGYPADAAEKRAMQDATILFNQTQQSSESPFLSTMQVDKDWLSTLFTVFRNSSMSYTRQTYDGARNLKRNLTSAQRAKSVAFMTKQILRDWEIDPESATDDEYSRANDAARKRFRRQIKKDVIRLATFGYVLEWLWNLGPYLPYIIFGYYISEKDKMWDDVITHSYFGSIEGLTGGDVMSSFGNMWASGEWSRNQLSKDMPLASDINTIANKFIGGKNAEAVNDILNLLVQSGIGMNPQSLTDAAIAITDACGDDPALSHEAAIFVMRVLQVPQSQLDKLYFDEIGLNGEEASKLTPQQLAARYAEYKVKRGTPLAPWSWGDEERLGKYEELAKDRMTERLESRGDAAVKEAYADFEARYKAVNEKAEKARAMIKTDYAAAAQAHAALQQDPDFTLYQRFGSLDKQLGRISKMWLTSKTPEEAALIASTIPAYRAGMVKVLQAETVENQQSAMSELTTLMNEFYSKYQAMQPQSQQLNR